VRGVADPASVDVLSATTRWALDRVEFTVDAALAVTVRGRFDRVSGTYEVGPDGARIEFAVDLTSVETGNALLDGMLRSADGPARFRSTGIRELGAGRLHVDGVFAAAGKAQPVGFDAAVMEVPDGLQLDAGVTVDRQQLGPGVERFAMFLPATVQVRTHFGPSV
jgi:polyisoprenoid-binding protein YceI